MRFFFLASLAALSVVVPAAPAGGSVPVRTQCSRLFSRAQFHRAAQKTYRGTSLPPRGSYASLWRQARCAKLPFTEERARGIWAAEKSAWAARRNPPMQTALASWYVAAGGPIACGGDSYALGVANKTLPCGTRLEICYASCVRAVVFDRGPYVAGRDLDLSGAVKDAIGFPDGVAEVRWRVLG